MMTAKRRPDRRLLIPVLGIAVVLLLVLLRPVSLARPEAQNPAQDRWVGYYMVLLPTAQYDFGWDWETYGDLKILNAKLQSDGRYAFTDLEGQALFFEFLPPTDPEDPYSATVAFQGDVAEVVHNTNITDTCNTETLSGTLYFGPATTPAPGGMGYSWTACLVYQREDGSLYLTDGQSFYGDGISLKRETKYTSTINGADSINFAVTATATVEDPEEGFTYYQLTAETAGTIGNEYTGPILPITTIPGLTSAQITDILVPGDDTETDDAFRERLIEALNNRPFGGNIADYRQNVLAIDGVGGVQVYPTWNSGGKGIDRKVLERKANLKVFGEKHAEGLFRFSTKSCWGRIPHSEYESHAVDTNPTQWIRIPHSGYESHAVDSRGKAPAMVMETGICPVSIVF